MKKLIIVTLITTCVALCAAVWPNNNATEQTPVPVAETAVSDQKATVAEIEEPAALAEKEKGTIPRQEAPREEHIRPASTTVPYSAASTSRFSTGRKNCSPSRFTGSVSTAATTRSTMPKRAKSSLYRLPALRRAGQLFLRRPHGGGGVPRRPPVRRPGDAVRQL